MITALSVMPHTRHKWMPNVMIGEHDQSGMMFALDVRQ
jgi:hypothetical protein